MDNEQKHFDNLYYQKRSKKIDQICEQLQEWAEHGDGTAATVVVRYIVDMLASRDDVKRILDCKFDIDGQLEVFLKNYADLKAAVNAKQKAK